MRHAGQEKERQPEKNPLEGVPRKHAPQQGPDVRPRTPPEIQASSKK